MGLSSIVRRFAVALACGAAALGAAGAAPAAATSVPAAGRAPAAPAAPAPSAAPGLEAFGACLAASRTGDIVVLVDESGSLKQTDPGNARVTAAKYLMERFADVADRTKYDIQVRLAGFSVGFTPLDSAGWTAVNGTSLPALERTIDQLASRNNGIDTDYWTALAGARRELATRRAVREAAEATPCQAVIMLTDGDLSIEPRRNADERKPYAPQTRLDSEAGALAAMAAARTSLCRAGGLADQVRDQGVITLAVGLERTAGAQNFALIQSVATGTAPGTTCGRTPTQPVGDFYRATGLADLIGVFDRMGQTQPPLVQGTDVCVGSPSDICLHSFVLDASVRSVHILGQSLKSPTLAVFVQPPDVPQPVKAGYSTSPGSLAAGPLRIATRWIEPGQVTLDVTRPASGPWSGQWRLWFVETGNQPASGAKARSQIQINSDLQPSVVKKKTLKLRSGEKVGGIQLGITRASDGSAVDPRELLGTARLDATFTGPDGTEVAMLTNADATEPIPPQTLDLSSVPQGTGVLRLRLAVTTQSLPAVAGRPAVPGTALGPAELQVPLDIGPPADYPTITVKRVDFGSGEDVTTLRAAMTFDGPGCVWVDKADVATVPEGVREVTVVADAATFAAGCVKAAEGAAGSVPLTMTLSESGNGVASGTLAVSMQPVDGGTVITRQVEFTGEVTRPVNAVTRGVVFFLTLLAGLGLPLAAAQFARWYGAKIPSAPLLAYVVPVRVDGGGVTRDGNPLALDPQEGTSVPLTPGGAREAAVGGARLRTRVDLDIRRAGYTVVDGGGVATVTGKEVTRTKGVPCARLPLTVHNSWFAVVPVDRAPTLVVLTSASATDDTRRTLLDDVRANLPRLVAELGPAQPATVSAGGSPGGSGGGFWSSDAGAGGQVPGPAQGRPSGGGGFWDGPSSPDPRGGSPSTGYGQNPDPASGQAPPPGGQADDDWWGR